jgi:hypothetical protein
MYRLILLVAIGLAGCTGLDTVTIPAQPTSLRTEVADSVLSALPPAEIEPAGAATLPRRIETFQDTVDARAEDLVKATVGDGRVVILTPVQRYTFDAPAYGETLEVLARQGGGVRAELTGRPEPKTVEAEVTRPDPPWYRRWWRSLKSSLAAFGALCLAGFFFIFIRKIKPFLPI